MISAKKLTKTLIKNKVTFFSGVPDSILKNFSNYIDRFPKKKHVISVNEGSAVSLGIGYYLSTKKLPCIYLQNSGLSNAINPIISIANKTVYSIPLILMIGWRGSPNIKDEPQHLAKGEITPDLLKTLGIKFCILKKARDLKKFETLIKEARKKNSTVACLIEKGVIISEKRKRTKVKSNKSLIRFDFLKEFINQIPRNSKIISTTGYTSRELIELRKNSKRGKDFYMVGGMGHSSSVAIGYSLHSRKEVYCLDGDGSVLMHMGPLRTAGFLNRKNFKHIILNNNSHESVGGQITTASGINFMMLSKSLGYKNFLKISAKKDLKKTIKSFIKSNGPTLLEVKIDNGTIKNLSRPKNLLKIKKEFMINR